MLSFFYLRIFLNLFIAAVASSSASSYNSTKVKNISLRNTKILTRKIKKRRDVMQNQILPHGGTEKELQQSKALMNKLFHSDSNKQDTLPASDPLQIRIPAEFEKVQAVIIAYNHFWKDFIRELAKHIAQANAEVWVLNGPTELSPDIPVEKYKPLSIEFDSLWLRDYGPIGLLKRVERGFINVSYRLHASRIKDDNTPCQLASHANVDCYSTSLLLDGGNLMFDGQRNLFMSEITYEWNDGILSREQVNTKLKQMFGVTNIYALPYAKALENDPYYNPSLRYNPADGTGHIDMFAKIVAPCVVIIAMCTNDDERFKKPLDQTAHFFSNLKCHLDNSGGTYTVHRIQGWYDEEYVWHTYTNSLIVNNVVILPFYSKGDNDAAVAIYRRVLPSFYDIVGINADKAIGMGGAIHCLTREIPAQTFVKKRRPPTREKKKGTTHN